MSHSYISYWEHDVWLKNIDITIVGSGIVGLSAAYFLKKKYPAKKVVVIERGFLPHGATTRNAGFSCFGSVTEILADIDKNGKEKAYQLVKDRFDGLHALIQLHGADAMGYHNLGGYEIFTQAQASVFEFCLEKLPELNSDLQQVLNIRSDVYNLADKNKAVELGLQQVTSMFFNAWEGQLHSGLLVNNLIQLCRQAGVEIFTGMEVLGYAETGDSVCLHTGNGVDIQTRQLVITTNGFARQLVSELDVVPARGQVMVTSPIKNLRLKGTFHHNEGFDYFRNIDNRVLIGGGRNLDMHREETTQMEENEKIRSYLMDLLTHTVLPGEQFNIEHEWSGIMGVGQEKTPIVKPITNQVFVAVRMGGMGVALGTHVGMKVADTLYTHT
jgi:glycine/D-amino acid oxidase-like deaminating enzyme